MTAIPPSRALIEAIEFYYPIIPPSRALLESIECYYPMTFSIDCLKACAEAELPAEQAREVEFLACAAYGLPERLKQLIDEGVSLAARVNAWLERHNGAIFQHCSGKTALHLASRTDRGSCIPVILEAAERQKQTFFLINARAGVLNETPLQLACERFDHRRTGTEVEFKYIQAMLDAGADPTLQDNDGRTAMHSLFIHCCETVSRPVYRHTKAIFDRTIFLKAEKLFRVISEKDSKLGLPVDIVSIIAIYASGYEFPELLNTSTKLDGTAFGLACTPPCFSFVCPGQEPLTEGEVLERVGDRVKTVSLMLLSGADPRLLTPAFPEDGIKSMRIIDKVEKNSKDKKVAESVRIFSQQILPFLRDRVRRLEAEEKSRQS